MFFTGVENVHNIYRKIEAGAVWKRDVKGRFASTETPVFSVKDIVPQEVFKRADEFIHQSLLNLNANKMLGLWVISKEEAYKIKRAAGLPLDLTGYKHVLVADDIRHSINRHGGDVLPIKEAEIREAIRALAEPDAVEAGNISNRGLPSIRFIKRKNDGSVTVVETVAMEKKELRIKTIWKDPSAGNNAAIRNPVHTSVYNGSLNSSINDNVAQNIDGVKDADVETLFSLYPDAIQQKWINYGKTFRENIEKALNKKIGLEQVVKVCDTPLILQELGVPDLPVKMHIGVAASTTKQIGKAPHAHELTLDMLEQIPEAINDPVFVMKSATQEGHLVIFTDLKDASGQSILVPLRIKQNIGRGNVANVIKTIYGRTNEDLFLVKQQIQGNILYANTEKSPSWLRVRGLQLPGLVTKKSFLLEKSITEKLSAVNNPQFSIRPKRESNEEVMSKMVKERKKKGQSIWDSIRESV